MTHILLVRHGETEWNTAGRYQGHSDIPLNAFGLKQAQAAADRLSGEPLDAIYASPLQRAWVTAQHIADHHPVEIKNEPRLMEMNFGEWEGLTNTEIQRRWPLPPAEWSEMMLHTGAPGGESLLQFADRLRGLIDDINRQHSEDHILLVAHSGVIKVMLCVLLDHPVEKYWQFAISQTSISEVATYPDGAILSRLNDTSHLNGVAP